MGWRCNFTAIVIVTLFSAPASAACFWTTLTNNTTADANQVMNNLDCLAPLASPHFTGWVGIGNTMSEWPLDVSGVIGTRGPTGSYTLYDRTNTSNRTSLYRDGNETYFWDNTFGNQITINNTSGDVGIGTSSPGQRLDVSGTIRQLGCTTAGTLAVNGSGDIICSSDGRLKRINGPFKSGLNAITHIQPVLFTYKSTANNPNESFVHAGFIAQNVKAVIPQASALQRDGYYSLDTTAILAAAVNAIKELKESNLQLKAANKKQDALLLRLAAKNNDLSEKISTLQMASDLQSKELGLLKANLKMPAVLSGRTKRTFADDSNERGHLVQN